MKLGEPQDRSGYGDCGNIPVAARNMSSDIQLIVSLAVC
jgi:hypothetical protein